ncbi:hypothetical protein ACKWRH_06630 [Bradyrhizobium sp. Pa8]|uniref:hypothetical protein n=1 Tax=Bradyrhizobium sp. Pa8 TaxID=3386552 RepID=UPI00403FA8D3
MEIGFHATNLQPRLWRLRFDTPKTSASEDQVARPMNSSRRHGRARSCGRQVTAIGDAAECAAVIQIALPCVQHELTHWLDGWMVAMSAEAEVR